MKYNVNSQWLVRDGYIEETITILINDVELIKKLFNRYGVYGIPEKCYLVLLKLDSKLFKQSQKELTKELCEKYLISTEYLGRKVLVVSDEWFVKQIKQKCPECLLLNNFN